MGRLATPWLILAVLLPFAFGLSVALADDEGPDRTVLTFADPEIVESSGLVVRDGLVATVNDSGDVGRTFVVDLATGETVGGVTWGEATDVEALAPTPDGGLLVGDIGDNSRSRDSVELVRVGFARGEATGEEARYRLTYPDGSNDAEALLVHPVTGEVLVATKGIFSGELYAAPKSLDELPEGDAGVLTPVAQVGSVITDGAFFPDGEHLILRDYSSATVYTYPGLAKVGTFDLPEQEQGEGIAVNPEGGVFVSTEGQFTSMLRVPLPAEVRRALAPVYASPSPLVSADPSASASAEVSPGSTAEPLGGTVEPEPAVEQPLWLWLGGVLIAGVALVVLVRSLRPR
ncbi:hypothetical protein GCM10027020_27240 [Nocardioides salsibiostraticola]